MIVVWLANVVSKKSESFGDNFLKKKFKQISLYVCNNSKIA